MIDVKLNPDKESDDNSRAVCANRKKLIVKLLYAYSIIAGVAYCFLFQDDANPIDILIALPFYLLGVFWCYADAGQLGLKFGIHLKYLILFSFYIGLPIYLVAHGFKSVFYGFLFILTLLACLCSSIFITMLVGLLMGLWVIT